jgi:hypothetical protein
VLLSSPQPISRSLCSSARGPSLMRVCCLRCLFPRPSVQPSRPALLALLTSWPSHTIGPWPKPRAALPASQASTWAWAGISPSRLGQEPARSITATDVYHTVERESRQNKNPGRRQLPKNPNLFFPLPSTQHGRPPVATEVMPPPENPPAAPPVSFFLFISPCSFLPPHLPALS